MGTYDSYCYSGYFYASDCDQWNMNSYNFGSYISSMCTYVNSAEIANANLADSLAARTSERNLALDQRDGFQADLVDCDNDFKTIATQRDACISNRDSYLNQLNSCLSVSTNTEANRQLWIAYAAGRNALIKKLYKACGAKCKRVK